jgi:hypothetical protein
MRCIETPSNCKVRKISSDISRDGKTLQGFEGGLFFSYMIIFAAK